MDIYHAVDHCPKENDRDSATWEILSQWVNKTLGNLLAEAYLKQLSDEWIKNFYNNEPFTSFTSKNFNRGSRIEMCWDGEVGESDEGRGKFELKQFKYKYIEEL